MILPPYFGIVLGLEPLPLPVTGEGPRSYSAENLRRVRTPRMSMAVLPELVGTFSTSKVWGLFLWSSPILTASSTSVFSTQTNLKYKYGVAIIDVKEQKLKLFPDMIQIEEYNYQMR
jgi:hypothetical protein